MRWESIMELMGLAKVVEELTAMENLQNADNTKKILIQLSDGTVFECIDPEIVKKIYQSIKSLNMSTIYDYKSIDALRYFHKTNLQLIDCNERKDFSEEFKKTTPVLTIAQIIDPETCCVTELGAKLIRGMKCDEENVDRLYKAIKNIENKVDGFNPAKLLNLGDVDGDAATLMTSKIKESIKENTKRIDKDLKKFLSPIFDNSYTFSFIFGHYPEPKEQVLKLINFLVTLSDELDAAH